MLKPFVICIGIYLGGVGYSVLEKLIGLINKFWGTDSELFHPLHVHVDTDEKPLIVGDTSFEHLQRFIAKDRLFGLAENAHIMEKLSKAGIGVDVINAENGMAQSPLLMDLLSALENYEIETLIRTHLQRTIGSLQKLQLPLRERGLRLHRRVVVFVVSGAGGGTGIASMLRTGQILREMKTGGELSTSSVIGLLTLASCYDSPNLSKQRAMAINHCATKDLAYQMSGYRYYSCVTEDGELVWLPRSGSFDYLMAFGTGQQKASIGYNDIIDQVATCVFEMGFSGVDVLSTLANEKVFKDLNQNGKHAHENRKTRTGPSTCGDGHRPFSLPKRADKDVASAETGSNTFGRTPRPIR